jgi:hypothetical protein
MFSIKGLAVLAIAIGAAASAAAQSECLMKAFLKQRSPSTIASCAPTPHRAVRLLQSQRRQRRIRRTRTETSRSSPISPEIMLALQVSLANRSLCCPIPAARASAIRFATLNAHASLPSYRGSSARPWFRCAVSEWLRNSSSSANALAILVGGGVDIAVSHGFAFVLCKWITDSITCRTTQTIARICYESRTGVVLHIR